MIKYREIHFYKNGTVHSVSSSHGLQRAFVSFPPFAAVPGAEWRYRPEEGRIG